MWSTPQVLLPSSAGSSVLVVRGPTPPPVEVYRGVACNSCLRCNCCFQVQLLLSSYSAAASRSIVMTKRAFASPFHDFCQEQRPLLPAHLTAREKQKFLGQRWQALSPAAKAKRKALLIPVFTCGRGGARTWVPATLEPEVTEAAVEDLMTFVLMDHDIERNASSESSDRDDVIEWLGLAAGLHEAVVNEAKPR